MFSYVIQKDLHRFDYKKKVVTPIDPLKWKTTPVTHVSYDTVTQRFKSCEKDILKQIQIAKSNYFNRIFTAYRTDMKKGPHIVSEKLT